MQAYSCNNFSLSQMSIYFILQQYATMEASSLKAKKKNSLLSVSYRQTQSLIRYLATLLFQWRKWTLPVGCSGAHAGPWSKDGFRHSTVGGRRVPSGQGVTCWARGCPSNLCQAHLDATSAEPGGARALPLQGVCSSGWGHSFFFF